MPPNTLTGQLLAEPLGRLDHLTFRGNLRRTRHGWLRLTPAYSVQLVEQLLENTDAKGGLVLDPFCGTATTALSCAERGIRCETTDINPFLIWFSRAKTRRYTDVEIQRFTEVAREVEQDLLSTRLVNDWIPPLHQVEKWWNPGTLSALGRAFASVRAHSEREREQVGDLLKVAFCRTLIAHAKVSFGHQSMSFKRSEATPANEPDVGEAKALQNGFARAVATIATGAASPIAKPPKITECDARCLGQKLPPERYTTIITSPPYPNRMSYIRELRPYMYWLGYLKDGRSAGELDWQAIGGTWGSATSNVGKWAPPVGASIPHAGFDDLASRIAERSPLLSRYVEKYFHDMLQHCRSLFEVVAPGGSIHYIVGNSKFYDTLVPVEHIFASLFLAAGFVDTNVRVIRKRSSKKELFEFVVSATKQRVRPSRLPDPAGRETRRARS